MQLSLRPQPLLCLRTISLALLIVSVIAIAAIKDAPRASASPVAGYFLVLDDATAEHMRQVFMLGREQGRRANVFAKVGDSITASGSFMSDIGYKRENLGGHTELQAVISFYRAAAVDRIAGVQHNSFNRKSVAARAGWEGADILGVNGPEPLETSPLLQEYNAIRPSVSIIMFGTNDIDRRGLPRFAETMESVIDQTLAAGIIPIMSTVPDRMDYPQAAERTTVFNDAIRQIAAAKRVPLIDYWKALQGLDNHGLQRDMVHPSIRPTWRGSEDFTERGLQYGWNVRNFLTLQMLKTVKETVISE